MKKTSFNRYKDIAWPPQCHNFDSTAGAGGFTAGAAAPAVNMLEEALPWSFQFLGNPRLGPRAKLPPPLKPAAGSASVVFSRIYAQRRGNYFEVGGGGQASPGVQGNPYPQQQQKKNSPFLAHYFCETQFHVQKQTKIKKNDIDSLKLGGRRPHSFKLWGNLPHCPPPPPAPTSLCMRRFLVSARSCFLMF